MYLTEAEVKVENITPERQAWFQGLESLYSELSSEEQKTFDALLKDIKAGKITKQDLENAASQEGEITEADEEEPKKGPKLITPLNKFLKSTTGKVSKLGLALAGAFSIIAPKVENSVAALTPNEITKTAHIVSADNTFAKDDKTTISWDDAKSVGANDGSGNSLQDLENEDNTATQFVKFKFGQGSEKGLAPEGGESINDIIDGLKVLDNAGEGEVNITISGEASNTGDGSDVPNDGKGSLANNRASTIEKTLQKKIDQLGLKNIKVNIDVDDTPQDHYKTLKKTSKDDGNKGAGTIVKIKTDVKSVTTTETPDEFVDDFNPAFHRWGWDYTKKKPLPQDEKPEPIDKKSKEQNTDSDAIPASPSDIKQEMEPFSKLNRNGQIARVLSTISPELSLPQQLGQKTTTSFSDTDLKNIINDKNSSKMAKVLAKLIPNLRKDPNAFLKRISDLTGIELEPRAKAIATKPGMDTRAQITALSENKTMKSLLSEAVIDKLFTGLGITPETVKNNRLEIIALVASMYASASDTTVSILDVSKLTDAEQKQLQGLGFTPTAGGNYIYLGAGKASDERAKFFDKKQGVKIQPDVKRIDKAIEADKPLITALSRINTQDELASLLTALFIYKDKKGQSIFPDDKTFTTDSGKVRSALFGLNYRLKEAEEELPFDVRDFYSRIDRSSNLKAALSKINSLEEFYQFILYNIFPRVNKSLTQDKTKLKAAIAKAANDSKQFAKKGKYDVDENLIKESSTQYKTEGLLTTDTTSRAQKDILSDIRSLPGVTIVSSRDYNPSDDETAFQNDFYYTILKIKIDPHPYMKAGGFKDEDLKNLLQDIKDINGVRNFKLTKSLEKATV